MLQLFMNGVPIPADAFVRLLESYSVSLSPIAKDDLLKYVVTIDRNGSIQHHKPRKYYITDEVHKVAKLFYEQLNNSEQ